MNDGLGSTPVPAEIMSRRRHSGEDAGLRRSPRWLATGVPRAFWDVLSFCKHNVQVPMCLINTKRLEHASLWSHLIESRPARPMNSKKNKTQELIRVKHHVRESGPANRYWCASRCCEIYCQYILPVEYCRTASICWCAGGRPSRQSTHVQY